MRQASKRVPDSAEKTVRDIRRATVGIVLPRAEFTKPTRIRWFSRFTAASI